VGDGRWDVALGHRWRRSLGSRIDEVDCRPIFGSGQDVMGRCVGGDI